MKELLRKVKAVLKIILRRLWNATGFDNYSENIHAACIYT